MMYKIAEKFKSIQGEGVYAGTPMAFVRFVGCSVGKKICNFCDTDFDKTYNWRGGGEFTLKHLAGWVEDYNHVCLTGGEPFDQDLLPFFERFTTGGKMLHIETSGTKPMPQGTYPDNAEHTWICVSPKPGFLEDVVQGADEIKVIVPGLGNDDSLSKVWTARGITTNGIDDAPKPENFRWPGLEDALRWADAGKIVFLQPRNDKFSIDKNNLRIVQDIIAEYPQLRLSVQMHKILGVQ